MNERYNRTVLQLHGNCPIILTDNKKKQYMSRKKRGARMSTSQGIMSKKSGHDKWINDIQYVEHGKRLIEGLTGY